MSDIEVTARLRRVLKSQPADVIEALVSLGFDDRTLSALYLVPLVHIAWADGEVCKHERKVILDAAKEYQLDDIALERLDQLLDFKTDHSYLRRCMRILVRLFNTLPAHECTRAKRQLLQQAEAVSVASRAVFGLKRKGPSPEQKELLAEIGTRLKVSSVERKRAEREELITMTYNIADLVKFAQAQRGDSGPAEIDPDDLIPLDDEDD